MLKLYLDNCCYNRPFDDLYSDGKGDYTEERKDKIENLSKEDLQKFLREELN